MTEFRAELRRQVRQLISSTLSAARAAQLGELGQVAAADGSLVTPQGPFQARPTSGRANSPPAPAGRTKGRRLQRLRTLQRAVEWQIQLETGQIGSRAQIAKREGISRAAVTQSMRALGGLAADVSDRPLRSQPGAGETSVRSLRGYRELRRELLQRFDADYVSKVLRATENNVSLAARLAKIDRKHLWRLMRRTGGQSGRSQKGRAG